MRYRLEWDGGPSAVIDIQQVGDDYKLRFEGPFRLTLRHGLEQLDISPDDLNGPTGPVTKLRRVAGSTGIASSRGGAAASLPAEEIMELLSDAGDSLFQLMLPKYVAADLRQEALLFLDVGTDENLLHVPWELMRDSSDFICLRHAMGRYVNLSGMLDVSKSLPTTGELSVLLISVPKPQPGPWGEYERLDAAQHEFEAIADLLTDRGVPFVPLDRENATVDKVSRALRGEQKFTIIHFTGHGHVDEAVPRRSGLVLFDGILSTGMIGSYLRHSPALAFINGCETARTSNPNPGLPVESDLPLSYLTRVFGIARPFLQQGSYVLGTRWRVSDTPATQFAVRFYASLLDGDPVGEAVMKARQAAYDAQSTDMSWASYVYYGDPRLVFRLEHDAPAEASADPVLATPIPTGGADAEVVSGTTLPDPFVALSALYVKTRELEPPGVRRTLALEQIVDRILQSEPSLDATVIEGALVSDDEGARIVGVAAARNAPHAAALAEPLTEVLRDPRSSFEEFHVLTTLRDGVDAFDEPARMEVRQVLLGKLADPDFLDSDRAIIARETLAHLT